METCQQLQDEEALELGNSSSYFYQTAFDTALVLGDREILCKITGLSDALTVLLFCSKMVLRVPFSLKLFHFTSTVRLSTRYSRCDHLEKIKTFTVESYITDQQLIKFLHKENKCCPVCLAPQLIAFDRKPRNQVSELVGSCQYRLLPTCVGLL